MLSTRGLLARLVGAGADLVDPEAAAGAAATGHRTARHAFEQFGIDLGEFLSPQVADFGAKALLVLDRIAEAFDLFGPGLQRALPVPALRGQCGQKAAL